MKKVKENKEEGLKAYLNGLKLGYSCSISEVYEAAGMHGSLMGFCLESLFLDNDALGQALRCVRGIEVNEKTLSVDAMRDVCVDGPGHYLGHQQTLELMQREYLYPDLANRFSPKEWTELGKPDIVKLAVERKKKVLAEFFPDHVDEAADRWVRNNFTIHLPRTEMQTE